MSQTSDSLRTKKQFKSQSVNNLFRQQATNSTTSDNHDHPSLVKKKSSGTTTKLKLVSKKVNTINRSKLEKKKVSIKETSPPVWSRSESPEVKDTTTTTQNTQTNQEITSNEDKSPKTTSVKEVNVLNDSTPSSNTPEVLPTTAENFNWADDDQDNIWMDLQNQIHNEIKPVKQDTLWSSPVSKISSFRKSTTPTISSLNQSPLVSSTSDIFNEPNDLFTLQTRQSSTDSRFTSTAANSVTDETPWAQNYNLWNTEDRQLSTKSDSTLLWSPFNHRRSDLDDPLRSLESKSRNTSRSRFFPSPHVEQEKTFIQTPSEHNTELTRSRSIDDSINDIIKLINTEKTLPDYLEPSSLKSEQEIFPDHFSTNPNDILVSFPVPYTTHQALIHQPKQQSYQEQYYPEGFASTFYKRGINNFMFVRELQPKLITSKSKDSVEVRISLPSINTELETEEDIFFKMRCYIINVGLRELNGKNNSYKVSQKSNTNIGNNYGRARYGNTGYTRSRRN